jgi:dihydrofolate reductase
MQAPARADEDTRGGFSHGGWAAPFGAMAHVGHVFAETDALLLGRRTYEDFHKVWPERNDSRFTPWLDNIRKYVVSSTLTEPLPWMNSVLVEGDVIQALRTVKEQNGRNILIMGSGALIRSLLPAGLIDELVLLIHPLVLGSGQRLFAEADTVLSFNLLSSQAIDNGVLIATYERQGPA